MSTDKNASLDAEKPEELAQVLDRLESLVKQHQNINAATIQVIDELLEAKAPVAWWKTLADKIPWKEIDKDVLREIAKRIHKFQQCESLLLLIIEMRILHIEDYEVMAEGMIKSARWPALHAITDAAKFIGNLAYGIKVASMMCPTPAPKKDWVRDGVEERVQSFLHTQKWSSQYIGL